MDSKPIIDAPVTKKLRFFHSYIYYICIDGYIIVILFIVLCS